MLRSVWSSLFVLYLLSTAGNQHWLVGLISGTALVLLIPIMRKGDTWQKMVAGILLFVPCFGLLAAVMD
jgi:hypothetical protein